MPSPPLLLAQPTSLLGRMDDLEAIRQRLIADEVHLLTLTGPPGVGKTRLALEAGTQLADHFPDGVTLVDLTPVRDPDRVLATIAQAVGVEDRNHRSSFDRVAECLRDRRPLLILDNFERVLAGASQLAELLAHCPGVQMLVTSRVPLHLRWEQTLRIPPLAVPDLEHLPPPTELAQIPAIALFLERVQTINQGFTLTMDNARSVTELCIHLDGLPLAIELAAARTSLLSPQMLLERLQQRLSLLRWDAPDLPERQHSLASAIGWSYDLLSDQEQELFRRLGVFVGGFDLETAQGMVDEMGERAMDVLECVGSLVDKSLIQVMGQGDEHVRYTLLETIREYAWEQLEAQGEVDTTAAAHARYFLNLAEQADPQLHTSDQRTWYVRLEREHNNLSVALRWLLDRQDETALRLAAALGDFWIYRGYHTEGRQWLEEALGSTGDADAAVRTRALLAVGLLLAYAGDLDGSRVVLEEALALAQQCQDRSGIALALTRLGARAVLAREWPEGTRPLQEALRQWEELGDQFEIGVTLFYQGSAAFAQGEYERAASLYSDALARYEAIGNERASGSAGVYLGLALLQLGDLARAAQLVQEGIQMSRTIEDRWHLSVGVNAALSLIGERAEQEEQARLLGAGDALRQITGTSRSAWERVPGQSTAHFREHVEQERWEAAYRQGRSLSFDDTATLTLGMLEDFTQTLAHPQTQEEPRLNESPLSNRELEVLTQVAEGLSSKAIGKQLFISTSTVNYHLTSIFNKLGVDTRAQAVAVAAQRGFL